MALNDLVQATPDQVSFATQHSDVARYLSGQRHTLYLGKPINGEHQFDRNEFWRNQDGEFTIDYKHNIGHILGNLLICVGNYPQMCGSDSTKKEVNYQSLRNKIRLLDQYLVENVEMYLEGKVDLQSEVGGFSGQDIFGDIRSLWKALKDFSVHALDTRESVEAARALSDTHSKIKEKYKYGVNPVIRSA